jgi:hypothetical protein
LRRNHTRVRLWLDNVFLLRLLLRRRCNGRSGRRGLGVERSDLQLLLVFLEDAVVVVFPELLGCVLSGNALEDW